MEENGPVERGGFSLSAFASWMGPKPVAVAMMSRKFSERLATMIFECTDAQTDPDMIAFAHQITNLNNTAYQYYAAKAAAKALTVSKEE